MDKQQLSDHDLLIRIDERTENIEKQIENHAIRIRRIETWFLPVLAFLSIIMHKITEWFGK